MILKFQNDDDEHGVVFARWGTVRRHPNNRPGIRQQSDDINYDFSASGIC
jgi:hypothetical protein